jgi:hypothetical protein
MNAPWLLRDCPMFGAHAVRPCADPRFTACRKCHATWKATPAGWVSTWVSAANHTEEHEHD